MNVYPSAKGRGDPLCLAAEKRNDEILTREIEKKEEARETKS